MDELHGQVDCGCKFRIVDGDIDYYDKCYWHAQDYCMDCEKSEREFDEYYMVKDEIWERAVFPYERRGLLCIGCLEERLGRQLRPEDFTNFPVNSYEYVKGHSWRQLMRLGYDLG